MIKKLLGKSELLKHVLILVQGTVIAQLIGLAMELVLRRVFTVSDFGIMMLYTSAVGILATIATGRYEMAIVLPKEDKNARSIFRLSMIISLLFNLILLIVLLFTGGLILDLIVENELVKPGEVANIERVKYLIYCVPLGVFLLSLYNALNYLFTRHKAYKTLSNNRVFQATGMYGSSALFGAMKMDFFGLVFGYLLGFITSIVFLISSKVKLLSGEMGDTRKNLKKYSDFPTKSLPSGLFNMLGQQLPAFFITGFFGLTVAGLYSAITRVLNAPITMVGRSVSQVFYQKISNDLNEGKPISAYIRKSTVRLLALMAVPMAIIFFFGEEIFVLLFEEEYRTAGKLAGYFSIFFLLRFVYYAESTLFTAVRKIGIEFRQNLFFLISQMTALFVGHYYYDDFETTFILLSLSGATCYAFFIFALIRTAKKADQ